MKRPWSGQEELPQKDNHPDFDPQNPLCPGVARANGQVKKIQIHIIILLY